MSKRAKHKSLSSDLNKSIRWLESYQEVDKIVLGYTENCRHKFSPGYLKIQSCTEAGIKIKGFSGRGVVDIFVVLKKENINLVKQLIQKKFCDEC